MSVNRYFLVFAIILFIVGSSCKKYADGPRISFRSATARLIQSWNAKSDKWNGQEEINLSTTANGVVSDPCGSDDSYTVITTLTAENWLFDKTGTVTIVRTQKNHQLDYSSFSSWCGSVAYHDNLTSSAVIGYWRLMPDEKHLQITFDANGVSDIWNFDILELREKEIKLSGADNTGQTMEVVLGHDEK